MPTSSIGSATFGLPSRPFRAFALAAGLALVALLLSLAVTSPALAADYDGDGVDAGDCAPLDPAVHPGASDRPDLSFEDTNCDGIDGEEAKAIFVSASAANDSGTGSKENPFQTFAVAIATAKAQGKDVYAMGGTYDQGTVALESGVKVYGGYKPVTGARSTDEITLIKGSPQAMLADGDTGVALQLLRLEATADGARSAYGVRAINGSSLVLQRVTATAGSGTAGSSGVNGAAGKAGEHGGPGAVGACTPWTGNPGPRAGGGPGGDSVSVGSNLPGFDGGDGGYGGAFSNAPTAGGSGDGPDGQAGGPAPANSNGLSGNAGTSAPGTGPAPAADGSNATFQPTSDSSAWIGFAADAGTEGAHGSGGGAGSGGAVRSDTSGTNGYNDAGGGGGGGGGEGGAGGGGGDAGTAGGGSFGVYAHDSSVVVEDSKLTSGDGGDGGNGGTGGNGGARGLGAPGGAGASCSDGDGSSETGGSGGPGGNGQPGGKGGNGGGGVGGPSFGIYVSGTGQHVSRNNDFVTGTPGEGGLKGGTTDRAASGQAAPTAGGTESTSSDFDADGVADVNDACPALAGDTDNGCPTRPPALTDSDGDGIPNGQDACSDEAAGTTDTDGDGCPGLPARPKTNADGDPVALEDGDCADNDSRRYPGNDEVPNNNFDEDCNGTDLRARVQSPIDAAWKWAKKSTSVKKLRVRSIPGDATLTVTCKKGRKKAGCPFKKKKLAVAAGGNRALTKLFRKKGTKRPARLKVGVVVGVRIEAPTLVGQLVKFKIRSSKAPAAKESCVPSGGGKPTTCSSLLG